MYYGLWTARQSCQRIRLRRLLHHHHITHHWPMIIKHYCYCSHIYMLGEKENAAVWRSLGINFNFYSKSHSLCTTWYTVPWCTRATIPLMMLIMVAKDGQLFASMIYMTFEIWYYGNLYWCTICIMQYRTMAHRQIMRNGHMANHMLPADTICVCHTIWVMRLTRVCVGCN